MTYSCIIYTRTHRIVPYFMHTIPYNLIYIYNIIKISSDTLHYIPTHPITSFLAPSLSFYPCTVDLRMCLVHMLVHGSEALE